MSSAITPPSDSPTHIHEMTPIKSAIEIAGEGTIPEIPTALALSNAQDVDWKAVGWRALSLLAGASIGVGFVFVLSGNPNGWAFIGVGTAALSANLVRAGVYGMGRKEVNSHLRWAFTGAALGGLLTAFAVCALPAMAAVKAAQIPMSPANISYMILGILAMPTAFTTLGMLPSLTTTPQSTSLEKFETEHPQRLKREIFDDLNNIFRGPSKIVKPKDWPTDEQLQEIHKAFEEENLKFARRKQLTLAQHFDLSSEILRALHLGASQAYDAQHFKEAHAMLELLTHILPTNSAMAESFALVQEKIADKAKGTERQVGYKLAAKSHEQAAKLVEERIQKGSYDQHDPLPLYMQCAKCYIKAGDTTEAATVLRDAIGRLTPFAGQGVITNLGKAQRMLDSIPQSPPA